MELGAMKVSHGFRQFSTSTGKTFFLANMSDDSTLCLTPCKNFLLALWRNMLPHL